MARCKLCLKSFDVENMGEAALKSHMQGKKNQQKYDAKVCPGRVWWLLHHFSYILHFKRVK